MKLRPVIRKVDSNHAEIVKTFRALSYSVQSTATIGKGFPDLIVAKAGTNVLIEIKDGKKSPSARKFTPDEEAFWRTWNGRIILIESIDDVIRYDRKHYMPMRELLGADNVP